MPSCIKCDDTGDVTHHSKFPPPDALTEALWWTRPCDCIASVANERDTWERMAWHLLRKMRRDSEELLRLRREVVELRTGEQLGAPRQAGRWDR